MEDMPEYDVYRNGQLVGTVTAASKSDAEEEAVSRYGGDVQVHGRWNEPSG